MEADINKANFWSNDVFSIREVVFNETLPVMARVSEGWLDEETESFSQGDLIKLDCIQMSTGVFTEEEIIGHHKSFDMVSKQSQRSKFAVPVDSFIAQEVKVNLPRIYDDDIYQMVVAKCFPEKEASEKTSTELSPPGEESNDESIPPPVPPRSKRTGDESIVPELPPRTRSKSPDNRAPCLNESSRFIKSEQSNEDLGGLQFLSEESIESENDVFEEDKQNHLVFLPENPDSPDSDDESSDNNGEYVEVDGLAKQYKDVGHSVEGPKNSKTDEQTTKAKLSSVHQSATSKLKRMQTNFAGKFKRIRKSSQQLFSTLPTKLHRRDQPPTKTKVVQVEDEENKMRYMQMEMLRATSTLDGNRKDDRPYIRHLPPRKYDEVVHNERVGTDSEEESSGDDYEEIEPLPRNHIHVKYGLMQPTEPVKNFDDLSIHELVLLFNKAGLGLMSNVCDKHELDGVFFSSIADDELKDKFHLDDEKVFVFRSLRTGWRPL